MFTTRSQQRIARVVRKEEARGLHKKNLPVKYGPGRRAGVGTAVTVRIAGDAGDYYYGNIVTRFADPGDYDLGQEVTIRNVREDGTHYLGATEFHCGTMTADGIVLIRDESRYYF